MFDSATSEKQGQIQREWSFYAETTQADKFNVQFHPSAPLITKIIVLAATFLMDLTNYEHTDRRRRHGMPYGAYDHYGHGYGYGGLGRSISSGSFGGHGMMGHGSSGYSSIGPSIGPSIGGFDDGWDGGGFDDGGCDGGGFDGGGCDGGD